MDFAQEIARTVRISEAIARAIERWSMYRHILIPTDGSDLAEHAVTNGLSLSRPVCPATRCRWRMRDPIKPLLQRPRTGAAISSSWDRTGAAGWPQSCSAV